MCSLGLRCCTAGAWLAALVVCLEIDEVVTGLVLGSVDWFSICLVFMSKFGRGCMLVFVDFSFEPVECLLSFV